MTREEARKILQKLATNSLCVEDYSNDKIKISSRMGAQALRSVSRERVKKVWRGCSDCVRKTCVACKHFGWAPRHCVDCENQSKWAPWNFCPVCGAPMTDEAVEMVMERLEALKDEAKD